MWRDVDIDIDQDFWEQDLEIREGNEDDECGGPGSSS